MAAITACEPPAERVRSLASFGSAVEVDASVPVMRYFRSGKEMMRMADVYYEEHNYENAFILYSKFITIFVEKLPKHPLYKQARPDDIRDTTKKVKKAFPKAEELKSKLKQIYEKEYRLWQEKEKQRLAEEERLRKEQEKWDEEQRRRHEAEVEEKKRLQEMKERALIEEQERVLVEQRQMILEEQRRAREREEGERRAMEASAAAAAAAAAAAELTAAEAPSDASLSPPSPGIPPPSYDAVKSGGYSVYKPAGASTTLPPLSPISPTAPPVNRVLKVDRSTKPTNLLSTVPSSKNRYGFKDLFVPMDIVEKFLRTAHINTTKNLETCGILAGKLAHDAFTITHIVAPKQTSTSDSCTALDEAEIFDVMDKNDLITLGWIHTHPTQTAFMSSIDLHTHCPYQIMMPEAVAIVCAPTHNQTGYFSLTPDHGLQFISNCKEAGFHPHPSQPPIYEEARHIKIADNTSIQLIDMR